MSPKICIGSKLRGWRRATGRVARIGMESVSAAPFGDFIAGPITKVMDEIEVRMPTNFLNSARQSLARVVAGERASAHNTSYKHMIDATFTSVRRKEIHQ